MNSENTLGSFGVLMDKIWLKYLYDMVRNRMEICCWVAHHLCLIFYLYLANVHPKSYLHEAFSFCTNSFLTIHFYCVICSLLSSSRPKLTHSFPPQSHIVPPCGSL